MFTIVFSLSIKGIFIFSFLIKQIILLINNINSFDSYIVFLKNIIGIVYLSYIEFRVTTRIYLFRAVINKKNYP